MITIPPALAVGTLRKSTYASVSLNTGVENGGLVVTSKVPGFFGNRISVEIVVDAGPGPPRFTRNGLQATFRMPSYLSFDASGPFFFEGVNPTFTALWYSGKINGRESFSSDGVAVTWPLDRDGQFVLFADNAWRIIQRTGGVNLMHWKSDSSHQKVEQTPSQPKSEENPEGWHGVADGCTGWISAHYNSDVTEASYFAQFFAGIAEYFIFPDPYLSTIMSVALAPGSSGSGRVLSIAEQPLTGGH